MIILDSFDWSCDSLKAISDYSDLSQEEMDSNWEYWLYINTEEGYQAEFDWHDIR